MAEEIPKPLSDTQLISGTDTRCASQKKKNSSLINQINKTNK